MTRLFKKKEVLAVFAAAVFLLLSCTNSDYDLSDIDSTVGFKVTDLTVPVNMDRITLDAMLDLDDDSQIRQTASGEYAIVENGTFKSDAISVPAFTAPSPTIEPIKADLQRKSLSGASKRRGANANEGRRLASYEVSNDSTRIDFRAEDVSEYIVSIDNITTTGLRAQLELSFSGFENIASEICIEDLVVDFIPGLEVVTNVGTYDAATGQINVGTVLTTRHKLTVAMDVKRVGRASGLRLENHVFTLSDWTGIVSGSINIYEANVLPAFRRADGSLDGDAFWGAVPQKVHYVCTPSVSDMEVSRFSGEIEYKVEGINIAPIELKNIPDVLNQAGTDIHICNPQLYLSVDNPLDNYTLKAQTGLKLTSVQAGTARSYTIDNQEGITMDKAVNRFCLSPYKPESYYAGTVGEGNTKTEVDFTDAVQQGFAQLADVLSGDGMPQSIEIDVVNPRIPRQTVTDFRLGEDIQPIEGSWVFYAPLQLTGETKIKYSDTIDGWNDDDLDALTITKMVVKADCETDFPLQADFSFYPIDKNGKRMKNADGTPVEGKTNKNLYPGMAEPVEIALTGTVSHLDGIVIEARLEEADGKSVMKPAQSVVLKNVKVTVSGSYEKEL